MVLHPAVLLGSKHHPRISNASVVVAFQQGVRDEKMLKKLTTHDVHDVSELFSLTDKCTRATEGRAWHSQPTLEAGKADKLKEDATAQSSGKNKNRKKKKSNNKPLVGAPTATVVDAVANGGHDPRGDK
jgi:hypothetical protein